MVCNAICSGKIIISVIVSIVLFFQQDNFYTWKIYLEFGLQ